MTVAAAVLERSGSFDAEIGRKVRGDRALVRQVGALAGDAGTMLVHSQRHWTSATFSGTRHRMTWAFDGADAVERAEPLLDLQDHEFDLPGQLVADAAIVSVDGTASPPRLLVELELLLLDED